MRGDHGVRRFRFNNPVYRKTTDDDIDGGGFSIAHQQMFNSPSPLDYPPDYTERVS